jgi:AGCS family alanine or glycine:cation symporter
MRLRLVPSETNIDFFRWRKVTMGGSIVAVIVSIVLWLVVAALFFTFYFGFINLRALKHAFRLVRGDFTSPDAAGEVTHFQALATALSGTVGLGNIAGVALAVSLGGPGATFWMIVAGLFSMSTKFAECTLGVKYRNEYADGTVSGGPMYYLSKGLAVERPAFAGLGKVLAVVFAVFCIARRIRLVVRTRGGAAGRPGHYRRH